jgi:Mce-associated membrane protein
MAGTPRKPIRPAGPRGKIRVAGSSPSARKLNPAENADESATTDNVTPETAAPESSAPEAVESAESGTTESGTVEAGESTPDVTAETSDRASTGEATATAENASTGETAATDKTVALGKPAAKSKPKVKGASLKKPATERSSDDKPAKAAEPKTAKAASGFLTWRKVAIVALLAVVFAVFAVVAAFKPGASTQSNMAFINSSETSALKAQAGDRICAVLSIDPTKFDDWADKAKTGLTGEALTEFNEYQSTSRDLAAQSGQGAECKVDLVAVSNMDGSSATVIATVLISTTQQGVAVLSGPGQARTELGMQKVDGQWRINRISDF